MAKLSLKGNTIHSCGELPSIGSTAPDFTLTKGDLSDLKLSDLNGKRIVLNIFPSIDTGVCAQSVRQFNKMASELEDTVVVCISADLPFAQERFCGAEGLENVVTASTFRAHDFGKNYGVELVDGPLRGLMSRAVVIIDKDGKVIYTEQVEKISDEPNYDEAKSHLK